MKKLVLTLLIFLGLAGCRWSIDEKIKGNGILSNETRNITKVKRVKLVGNFDIQIAQNTSNTIEISADANLMNYIMTKEDDDMIKIYEKSGYDISSHNPIKIIVNIPLLQEVSIAGNGNVSGLTKFTGSDKLDLTISGNGDISIGVNTPIVEAKITGNGNIMVDGETKESKISITGNGDFKGENLKAENTNVRITGSGNATVFASNKLDARITGGGDVLYSGNPNITKHITGSGEVKQH